MEKPYLVQRGSIKHGVIEKLSSSVDLDYMGSAEFEFGALPKSLRRIQADFDKYASVSITVEDLNLHVFLPSDTDIDQYHKWLSMVRRYDRRSLPLKEWTGFEKGTMDRFGGKFDFWWDIDNDIMWSTDGEFINNLPSILRKSFEYMDSKKKEA